MPILQLFPVVILLAALVGIVAGPCVLWAAIATVALLVWWAFVYWFEGQRIVYTFCFPVGAVVVLYIFASAIVRGHKVSWKGRDYVSTTVMNP